VKISTALYTPVIGTAFGSLNTPPMRGISSVDKSGNYLLVSYDNGYGSGDSVRMFNASTASLIWRIGDANAGNDSSIRGSAAAFDPGYVAGGSPAPAASYLARDSGRRHRLNTATGTYVDGFNFDAICYFAYDSNAWRDMVFDPATGDLYMREANRVGQAARTADNAFAGQTSVAPGVLSYSPGVNLQNIAFMNVAGQGKFLIFNERSSQDINQNFATVINVVSTNGSAKAVAWDVIPFTEGNGAYDFSWDAASQTIAIADMFNSQLYIYGLTAVPQPVLQAKLSGLNVILSWPTNSLGYTLQSTTDFTQPNSWTYTPPPPVVSGGFFVVTNPVVTQQKYYRLKK
jgi:hypothetical protein